MDSGGNIYINFSSSSFKVVSSLIIVNTVYDTGGKFASGVVETGGNFPLASTTTPAANLPPVSLGKMVENFAAGVVDTGGNFDAGVNSISGAP